MHAFLGDSMISIQHGRVSHFEVPIILLFHFVFYIKINAFCSEYTPRLIKNLEGIKV